MGEQSKNPPPPIRVGIGILVHDDRVLIGRRPPHVRLAGLWEFPGGKCADQEPPQHAVVRELREELGVVVTISRALPSIVHRDPDLTVELFPFLCRIDDAHCIAQIRPHANSELRWVRPAELSHYHFPLANAPLLRQLQSILAPDG